MTRELTEAGDSKPEDKEQKKAEAHMSWKDYLALLIAALETVLLPLVVIMALLFIVSLLIVLR